MNRPSSTKPTRTTRSKKPATTNLPTEQIPVTETVTNFLSGKKPSSGINFSNNVTTDVDSLLGSSSQEDPDANSIHANNSDTGSKNHPSCRNPACLACTTACLGKLDSQKQIPTFELCRFCYRPAFSNLGQGDLTRCKPTDPNIIKDLPAKENFLKRDLSYLYKNFRTTKLEILPPSDEIPLVGSKILHEKFKDILDESNYLVVHHCCASWSDGVTAQIIPKVLEKAKKSAGSSKDLDKIVENEDYYYLVGIDIAIKKSLKTKCVCCEKYGASVFCKKCGDVYHYPCCVADGCFLILEQNTMTMICGNCVDTLDNLVSEQGMEVARHFLEIDGETSCKLPIGSVAGKSRNFKKMSEGEKTSRRAANLRIYNSYKDSDNEEEMAELQPVITELEEPEPPQIKQIKGYMYCVTCGRQFYGEKIETIPSRTNRAGWQCPDCKVCQGCRLNTDEDKMIICDKCDGAFHMDCLSPKLTEVPSVEEWFCPNCDPDGKKFIVYSQDIKDVYLNAPNIELNLPENSEISIKKSNTSRKSSSTFDDKILKTGENIEPTVNKLSGREFTNPNQSPSNNTRIEETPIITREQVFEDIEPANELEEMENLQPEELVEPLKTVKMPEDEFTNNISPKISDLISEKTNRKR